MSLEQVVVALDGGIGNQLFQYAAGRAIADESGAELLIHERFAAEFSRFVEFDIRTVDERTLRRLVLDRPIDYSIFESIDWRLRTELLRARRRTTRYRQKVSFDARPPSLPIGDSKILGLVGYFQHPSWFEPTLSAVTASLGAAVDRSMTQTLQDQILDMGDYTVVSFRRGDYLRYATELRLSYYERALELLPRRNGPLVIISDDELIAEFGESWFAERGFDVIPQTQLGPRSRLRDLAILSRATQVVTANSTFCWWGTVLGELRLKDVSSDRFVVASKDWLREPPGSEVLVRPSWIAI